MARSDHIEQSQSTPAGGASGVVSEAIAQLWPEETRQFEEALGWAREGSAMPAALVGEPGCGKTWFLSGLINDARAAGDTALHVHLDRYFTPDAFAAHVSTRLLELNDALSEQVAVAVPTGPSDLPALFQAANAAAREADHAVVVAFSGWDAHLDAPADTELSDYVRSLLSAARSVWRNTLTIVELRAQLIHPALQALARSGLVYFPMGAPSDLIVERLLGDRSPELVPFSPNVGLMAADRARGNLHRLAAAMRSISARAAAAGISEVGPVEWEALGGKGMSSEIQDIALPERNELLTTIVDWPAGGYIPLDEIAWRLRVQGVARTPEEFSETIATLQAEAAVLGLETHGDPPHLRFDWSDLRTALGRAVLGEATGEEIALRRRLQASVVEARQNAAAGAANRACDSLEAVIGQSAETGLEVFRRQAATVAGEVWRAVHEADVAQRARAAELLASAAGPAAARMLAAGLTWEEPELQGAAGTALAAIGELAIRAVAELVDSDDYEVRLRAIALLAQFPSEQSVEAVLPVLGEPDTDLRLTALSTLSSLGSSEAGEAVADLVGDNDPAIRATAIRCIASLKYSPALGAVAEALVDETEDVRDAAGEALGALGDEQAVPALMERLADTRDQVRAAAAKALTVFGERARRALLEGLRSGQEDERAAAVYGFLFFPPRQAVPAVLNCLRDSDRGVVEAAAECLANFGEDAVEPVASLLAERDDRIRADATHTLALIGEPAAPALEERLRSRAASMRVAAALALGQMRHGASAPALADLAQDRDNAVRLAAIRALCMIGSPEALGPIVEAMSDENPEIASEAASSIVNFGEAAIPPLVAHLVSPSGEVVEAAAGALTRFGTKATRPLCEQLSLGNPQQRAAVLEILRRLEDPASTEAIADCLGDRDLGRPAADILVSLGKAALPSLMARLASDDAALRKAATRAAVQIGRPALQPAVETLQHDDPLARAAAADLLGQLGEPQAVPALVGTLTAQEPSLRAASAAALGQITDARALEPLAASTRDPASEVVSAAVTALRGFGEAAIEVLLKSYEAHANGDLQPLGEIVEEMGPDAVILVSNLLSSDTPELRTGAVYVLAAMRHEPSMPGIVALLADADEDVATAARAAAADFGEAAADPLADILLDPDESLRRVALTALLQIGAPALPSVINLLSADTSAARSIGVWAAAAFGEDAVPAVAEVLTAAQRPHSRRTAAVCLSRIATASAIDALIAALGDPMPAVRITVIESLTHAADPRAVGPLLQCSIDEDAEVTQAAREAILEFAEAAIPALIEHLDADTEELRTAVAEVLVAMAEVATPALMAVVAQDSPSRQAPAIRVLRELRAEDAADPILDLLAAPSPAAEAALEFALELPDVCIMGLLERIGSDDTEFRHAVSKACIAIGEPTVAPLTAAVTAGSEAAKTEAIGALAEMGDERALDPIVTATRDRSASVRGAAGRALGKFADPQGLDALCALIVDEATEVREVAAASLRAFGASAIAALLEHFAPHDKPIPEGLVEALRDMGRMALKALTDLVHAQSPATQAGAINCLTALEYEDLPALIPDLLGESDEAVRDAVLGIVRVFGEAVTPHALAGLAQGGDAHVSLATECLMAIGEPAVDGVVDLLRDLNSPNRHRAIPVLARLGSPAAIEPLIQVMAERDDSIRVPAQDAVAEFGADAVGPLFERLEDRNPVMRESVAAVLAKLDDLVRPTMLEILATDTTPRRITALAALRDMGATEAIPDVADLIVAEPGLSQPARQFLLEHTQHAVPALCERLQTDDEALREAAGDLLTQVGEPALEALSHAAIEGPPASRLIAVRALSAIGGELAVLALSLAITDPEPEVRAAAAAALVGLGALSEVMPVIEDPDESVREATVRALLPHADAALEAILETFAGPEGIPSPLVIEATAAFGSTGTDYLCARLDAEGAEGRAGAIRFLSVMDHAPAFPAITQALTDPDNRVRETAAESLVTAGPGAVRALTAAVTSADSELQKPAADCLTGIGEPAAATLIDAASDPATSDRPAAIGVLVRIDPPGIQDRLIAWLGDDAEAVEVAAAKALGELGREEAVPHLLEGIDTRSEAARDARLDAICSFGEVAVPILIDIMDDPAWSESPALARALATLGDAVEDAILKLLDKPEPRRRLLAARTLRDMRLERAAPKLLARVVDEDEEVREAAALALAVLPVSVALPLLDNLAEKDPGLRSQYVDAVCLQTDELLDLAAERVNDDDPSVRVSALLVIGRMNRQQDSSAAIAALEDDVPSVRALAARTAAELGGAEAAEALAAALYDPDEDVLAALVTSLKHMGPVAHPVLFPRLITPRGDLDERVATALDIPEPDGMAVVRSYLDSEDLELRIAAVMALGHIGREEDIPALAKLLDDEESEMRDATQQALVRQGPPAVPSLAAVLWEGRRPSSWTAGDALRDIGQPAVEPLLTGLPSANDEGRRATIAVLTDIRDADCAPAILPYLADAEESVRVASAAAMQTLRHEPALPALLDDLDDEAPGACEAKLTAIVSFGVNAVPAVLETLAERDWRRDIAAAEALRRIGSPAQEAAARLLTAREPRQRWLGAKAIGLGEATQFAAELTEAITDETDEVRQAAAESLVAMDQPGLQALLDRLAEPDEAKRQLFAAALADWGDEALDRTLVRLHDPDRNVRLGALAALTHAARPPDVNAIGELLSDDLPDVRAAACTALSAFATTESADFLVAAIHQPDEAVAAAVVEALRRLGRIGAEALVSQLVDETGQVHERAAQVLGALGPEGLSVLHEYLRHDQPTLRAVAASALAYVGDEAAIPSIAELLADPEASVQSAAGAALVAYGTSAVSATHAILQRGEAISCPAASDALATIGAPAIPFLVDGLPDGPDLARATALHTLIAIGDPSTAPKVASCLSDASPEVRAAAAVAVQRFEYDAALPQLLDNLDDEPPDTREHKLAAACSFGDVAVPVLLEKLEDPARAESEALLEALSRLRGVAGRVVIESLGHPSASRRLVAVRVLEALKVQEAVEPLAQSILDEDSEVRARAARALAAFGPDAGKQLLTHLDEKGEARRELYAAAIALQADETLDEAAARLDDRDPAIRAVVLDLLSRAARPSDQTRIAACLQDDTASVRAAACSALKAYHNHEAAEALLTVLHDDESVFEAAIEAMSAFQEIAYELLVPRVVTEAGDVDQRVVRALSASGTAAEPILRECLTRDAPGVRGAAAVALASVAGEDALEDLLPLLSDSERTVRESAVKALVGLGQVAARPALEMLTAGLPPACLVAADLIGQVGVELSDELIPTLRADRPGARAGAARALGLIGDTGAGAHLVARLKDPDPIVRVEAATSLGLLAWAKATPHLLSALDDEDSRVSKAAINALTNIGEPAIEVLVARLVGPQGDIRDDVVYALAGIGEASVAPLLRATERGGESLRLATTRVLSIIGGSAAVVPLVDALLHGSPDVREEAFRAVQSVGRVAVSELVARLSQQPAPELVERLAFALVELREAALPEVVTIFEGPHEALRQVAADILGGMGMVAAPALRRAMGHASPAVRTLALTNIARIGDVSTVPDVIELLDDADTGVIAAAIHTLAELDDPRGVAPAIRCVGSSSPAVREALDFAVSRFGARVASPLVDMLISDDPLVTDQATGLLRSLGKGALSALQRKLESDLPEMRIAVAAVMGGLGAGAVVDPLVTHLDDPEPEVRRAVAEALGAIGGPAVGPVLRRLPEPDELVADGILMALNAMTVDPVYTLMEMARDADEAMRLAAVRMSGRYAHSESVPTLQQRLHDTSLDINCAAAEALGQIATEDAIRVLAEESVTDRPEVARAIRTALETHAPAAIPMLVSLAARAEDEPDPAVVEVATDIARHAPGIVDELLSHDQEDIRRTAAVVLGDVGDSQSLRSLVRKARDRDAPVRRAAAVALGRMGDEALGPLSDLLRDQDPEVQKSSAGVLASLGPSALEVLLRQLRSSRDAQLRATICVALGRAQATDATDALLTAVEQDRDDAVSVAAAAALAQLGRSEGLGALEDALRSDDQDVRADAAEAIAALGGGAALSLVALVEDLSPRVRQAATQAFKHVGASDVPLLLQYTQHNDAAVRAAVATALREAPRDPEALRALALLLQDDDETVCAAAVESLIVFGDTALQFLSEQALSDDSDTRYAACWALGQLGTLAVDALLQIIPGSPPDSRADILRALGHIGDPRARETVLGMLSDDNPRVRVAAVGAMRRLATDEDSENLARALTDLDANVRMVATSVIAAVITDKLREAMIDLLTHESPEARGAAVQVLRQDCHPSALQPLQRTVGREPEPWVAELMEGAIQAIAERE